MSKVIKQSELKDVVRDLATYYQQWCSENRMSYDDVFNWTNLIEQLAELVDDGEFLDELKENGVL